MSWPFSQTTSQCPAPSRATESFIKVQQKHIQTIPSSWLGSAGSHLSAAVPLLLPLDQSSDPGAGTLLPILRVSNRLISAPVSVKLPSSFLEKPYLLSYHFSLLAVFSSWLPEGTSHLFSSQASLPNWPHPAIYGDKPGSLQAGLYF